MTAAIRYFKTILGTLGGTFTPPVPQQLIDSTTGDLLIDSVTLDILVES